MLSCRTGLSRIRRSREFGACNGGWAYDAYPELETLNRGRAITRLAVITNVHSTQHGVHDDARSEDERRAISTRGVLLEVYYDGVPTPAVMAPIGDFFGDGCGGRATHFSTPFVEKAPESYNCFIPMPFERSARVVLRNETPYDFSNYSFVEFERLPEWDPDHGYFHATWNRKSFQLHGDTDEPFFHVDGCGHLIGRAWSVATDEPYFRAFHYVMEGNNEVRIGGDVEPRVDYLGTEDSFAFSWGFQRPFIGLFNGINYVRHESPSMLSIYRFRGSNAIRFNESLDWRIDWSHDWKAHDGSQREIAAIRDGNSGWVDHATTFYWYQASVGYEHAPMLSLEDRARPVLVPSPQSG